MAPNTNFRPTARARTYTWLDRDGTRTRGVALKHRDKILAHMTPEEARALADRLHDLADRLDTETEQPTAAA